MKTLQQIKDDFAKEKHCEDWIDLLMHIEIKQDELDVHDEIAIRYARECCRASLEKAAHSNFDGDMVFFEEITNKENIVLL